jgi:hypothetical protein
MTKSKQPMVCQKIYKNKIIKTLKHHRTNYEMYLQWSIRWSCPTVSCPNVVYVLVCIFSKLKTICCGFSTPSRISFPKRKNSGSVISGQPPPPKKKKITFSGQFGSVQRLKRKVHGLPPSTIFLGPCDLFKKTTL